MKTSTGWIVKAYYVGKARDFVIKDIRDKKRVTSDNGDLK
ncbi:hypothetical protein CLPU_6c00160 [Gottschalkia purinilytica]|uniref:Uncharacterized protein n=1 Tax=Gottschalkia purinilytica TaxID=1503 RepID=A0A0L0WB29_GOTPU|nr:hypothetical protein CLPU_6c00160 [Gottschalkia purinilytica]